MHSTTSGGPDIKSFDDIMLFKIVSTIFLAWLGHFLYRLQDSLDWQRTFTFKHSPGACTQGGSEDITHIGNGLLIGASGYGLGKEGGGVMKLVDVNGPEPRVFDLNLTNTPSNHDFMSSPTGISTWKDPKSGHVRVFVMTHAIMEDRIEVFDFLLPGTLKHVRTITDPAFKYMNNMVAVGKNEFYITKYYQFRDAVKIYAEILSLQRWGKVLYYDGHRARVVASDLRLPNGINVSPDRSMVYVAEYGTEHLIAYHRQPTNSLVLAWAMDVHSGLDNIEVDPQTGDMWIAAHPIMWKIYFGDMLSVTAPSQVLKFKMHNHVVTEIIDVYADDGTMITGATTATFANGKLIVSSLYDQVIVCNAHYIS